MHNNGNYNLKLTNRTGWRLNFSRRIVASVVRMPNSQEQKKEIDVHSYLCFSEKFKNTIYFSPFQF